MGMAVLRSEGGPETRSLAGEMLQAEPPVFDKLRELVRQGYVPDCALPAQGEGLLLLHPSGPTLVLRPDGSIDLPVTQGSPSKSRVEKAGPAPAQPRRMAWLRTVGIVFIFATLWLISVAFTSTILEGM